MRPTAYSFGVYMTLSALCLVIPYSVTMMAKVVRAFTLHADGWVLEPH